CGAVFVDTDRGEQGQQLDEVQSAVTIAAADVGFGNVMAAAANASTHALDVELCACEAGVPDVNLDAPARCRREQLRNGAAAERRLEREVEALGDRFFEQSTTLLPSDAVNVGLRQAGVSRQDLLRRLVGI